MNRYLQTPQTIMGIENTMASHPMMTMPGRFTNPTIPIPPANRPIPVQRKARRVRSLARIVRPRASMSFGPWLILINISSLFIICVMPLSRSVQLICSQKKMISPET